MPADFSKARSVAVKLLLASRLYSLKFDVTKLKFGKHVLFDSYSNFCANSLATVSDFTQLDDFRDGCTIRREVRGSLMYLVLYNDREKSLTRRRFTLAHEIGHMMLEHERDDSAEEAEANCFAAELLLPRILLRELQTRTEGAVTAVDIAELFGASKAASEYQRKATGAGLAFSDDEKRLLKKLSGFLPDFDAPVIGC